MKGWSLENAIASYFEAGFKDGDVVPHDFLRHVLEIPSDKNSSVDASIVALMYMERFDQLRDHLLVQHKIYLSNVRGRGYLVVPPSDQAHTALSQAMKDIKRAASKCSKVLEYARLDAMDDEARKRHVDTQCRFDGFRAMINRQRPNIFELFKQEKLNSE